MIILAGAKSSVADASIQVQMEAMEEALGCSLEKEVYPQHIYTDCTNVAEIIHKEDPTVSWRFKE